MEILELIFVLLQSCSCVGEMLALGSTVGTGTAGVKAYQNRKGARGKFPDQPPTGTAPVGAEEKPPPGRSNFALIVFFLLLPISVLLWMLIVLARLR